MAKMKTPGVYIVENNAFSNSIVTVATAVPAFVGYTERADNKGKTLHNKPWRITSMAEFENYYGVGPDSLFSLEEKKSNSTDEVDFTHVGKEYFIKQSAGKYILYRSMLLFFHNGGGPCYIVSVGDYSADVDEKKLIVGVDMLIKEDEPTLIVIPETTLLDAQKSISVQQSALAHCGGKMRNRIAILDIWGGDKDRQDPAGDCIEKFRDGLGIHYLDFSAAYYPWVNTTIVQDGQISYQNISNAEVLQRLIKSEMGITKDLDAKTDPKEALKAEVIKNITSNWTGDNPDETHTSKALLNKSLMTMSPLFCVILETIKNKLNLLPPAAAMAGIYTMVDNTRGVWKAPANVGMAAVISPSVNITNNEQEDLNVTAQGKSINAIRTFIGQGTLVWGARTLDGNSLDWRYINVRRTMIMLEESIRLAMKAYVFESNTSNTWTSIKGMIVNFLTSIWKQGGLAGASPDDAFSVHVGLGDTMAPEDVIEGILRVSVLVAISHPAEFIEITLQQQLQKT